MYLSGFVRECSMESKSLRKDHVTDRSLEYSIRNTVTGRKRDPGSAKILITRPP